jgi:hypothetical protein
LDPSLESSWRESWRGAKTTASWQRFWGKKTHPAKVTYNPSLNSHLPVDRSLDYNHREFLAIFPGWPTGKVKKIWNAWVKESRVVEN